LVKDSFSKMCTVCELSNKKSRERGVNVRARAILGARRKLFATCARAPRAQLIGLGGARARRGHSTPTRTCLSRSHLPGPTLLRAPSLQIHLKQPCHGRHMSMLISSALVRLRRRVSTTSRATPGRTRRARRLPRKSLRSPLFLRTLRPPLVWRQRA